MRHRLIPVVLCLFATCTLLACRPTPAHCSTQAAYWNFTRGAQGWTQNSGIMRANYLPEGLVMEAKSPDPYLTSPPINCPAGQYILVTIRMRSNSDPIGQVYFGTEFAEKNSRTFSVKNDGKWHEYRIPLPPLEPGSRLRLDPCHDSGTVALAWIKVEANPDPPAEAWARPSELRGKKFIAGGQYGTNGGESAITSRFLAQHPTFLASFPFDGYVVPGLVDGEWAEKLGLPRRDYFLHELLWNSVKIPYEAIAPIVRDLRSVKWGALTDNFLYFNMIDGARGRHTPDFTNDNDWAIIESNAATAARLCREAKLQGFWLDTEQYGNYRWRTESGVPEFDPNKPTNVKFPLGKDTPEVLRRRGAQWIRAIQKELPTVKIIITFAWSPEHAGYGPLKGVTPFLDGVLDAIQAPGQLIHGFENTFYFGQGPGTTHVLNDGRKDGYPGGRDRFETSRTEIRDWRRYSVNPKKYDSFVKIGMAAWVEDDPWNLWEGTPSGTRISLWSNLALALAYSDEYVWIWSEHTKYGQASNTVVNPFLSSLSNQTFNTGQEAVTSFSESFASDPLRRGWYFDFDMLAIGRKSNPDQEPYIMSAAAVPYAWSHDARAVRVDGTWPRGSPTYAGGTPQQRRRYVRAIKATSRTKRFQASLDFRIESFGASSDSPIVMGLFHSDQPLKRRSLTLQVGGPDRVHVVLTANGKAQSIPMVIRGGMKTGQTYRIAFDCEASSGLLSTKLSGPSGTAPPVARVQTRIPAKLIPGAYDEIGISLSEGTKDGQKAPSSAYRYFLQRAELVQ